jgi:hypothetical protein
MGVQGDERGETELTLAALKVEPTRGTPPLTVVEGNTRSALGIKFAVSSPG